MEFAGRCLVRIEKYSRSPTGWDGVRGSTPWLGAFTPLNPNVLNDDRHNPQFKVLGSGCLLSNRRSQLACFWLNHALFHDSLTRTHVN